MAKNGVPAGRQVPCEQCPLRGMAALRDFSADELEFIAQFKSGELNVEPGTTILQQGANSAHLFTALSGWGFRYKTLEDGRRQILNFVLPGDFIGLQAGVLNEMQHSVEALTNMTLCVFPRDKLWGLYEKYPSLAFDLTWLAAREEHIIDENLLNVGRRSALERVAFLFIALFVRAQQVGLTKGDTLPLPFTQQHLADTLGMSLVHTNKTLKRLTGSKAVRWKSKLLEILDRARLVAIAGSEFSEPCRRPFM
jgi:CRP/FNR family transcriptional regulator